MRYTYGRRLEKITQEVYLSDMDKNVVDFMPNFDETEKEPVVLPVRVPNLSVKRSGWYRGSVWRPASRRITWQRSWTV